MGSSDEFPRHYTLPYEKNVEGPGYWMGSKAFVLNEKYIITSNSDWKWVSGDKTDIVY
jgi:hypothetical protein